jgi:hypothetical protein
MKPQPLEEDRIMVNFLNRRSYVLGICSLVVACAPTDTPTSQSVQRITCAATKDCAARGGSCVAGQCVADNECKVDADCVTPQVCLADANFGGLCGQTSAPAAPLPFWSCTQDSDCPTNQVCTNKLCGPAATLTPTPTPIPTPTPTPTEICDNRLDDDGDGLVDCADPDCAQTNLCRCQGTKSCPCDVLLQNCTGTNERCWIGGPLSSDGQCYPIGPKTLGQPCEEPPVDGLLACGKGLVCVAASDTDPMGTCRQLCGPVNPCPTSFQCTGLDLGGGVTTSFGVCVAIPAPPPPPPPAPCSVFTQNCSTAGQMCVAVDGYSANQCVAAGKGVAGASCTQATDCAPGLQCAALVGVTPPSTYYFNFDGTRGGNCLPACLPGGAPACPSGSTCSPVLAFGATRTDIGVCY